MTKPITIPNSFSAVTTATGAQIDADFSAVSAAINDPNTYNNYLIDTGAANAYVVTFPAGSVPTSYIAGLSIQFKPSNNNSGASTINVNGLGVKSIVRQDGTAAQTGDINTTGIVSIQYDGTNFVIESPTIANIQINDFRLTLTSGTPVTTADVATATTIYMTPFIGNRISLYDGSKWNIRNTAEISIALGTLTANLPYDLFCYDNSGIPTLEMLAWTNTTTRATALAYQDGILVKTGVSTRRYIGTFYTISTTQTCDSSSVGRYLFNYYNQVYRYANIVDATASWTQTAGTRQANANTANQFNFVVGFEENPVEASVAAYCSNGTGGQLVVVDIGLDSTSTSSASIVAPEAPAANIPVNVFAWYKGFTGIGKHSLVWLENTGGGTTTWSGTSSPRKSGMLGGIWA